MFLTNVKEFQMPRTAKEAFQVKKENINEALSRISAYLSKENEDPKWDSVGSLGYAYEKLQEIVDFLYGEEQ